MNATKTTTIEDMARAQIEMQEAIRQALMDFSNRTGMWVEELDSTRAETVGGQLVDYHIETKVVLPAILQAKVNPPRIW